MLLIILRTIVVSPARSVQPEPASLSNRGVKFVKRGFMRSLTSAFLLAASVSSAHALDLRSVVGTWSGNGMSCSRIASNKALLFISEARFRYDEIECRIGEAVQTGDALNLRISCDAAGKQEDRDVSLRLTGRTTLVVTQGPTAMTYKACDRRDGSAGASARLARLRHPD